MTTAQIDRHIEVLEEFERLYSEFLVERRNRRTTGEQTWSSREWAERERRLRALAPRAEVAMEASGLGAWQKTFPLALGGGVMSDDLSTLIFDFECGGFSVESTDDEMQWDILTRLPSQIEGLKMQREAAEALDREGGGSGRAGRIPHWAWLSNVWVVTVVGGIVVVVLGGLILAAILGS
jgi:hypothetical protein